MSKRIGLIIVLVIGFLLVSASLSTANFNSGFESNAAVWEYARLDVNQNNVTWHVGDTNQLPRQTTIAVAIREQGGSNFSATLPNLLNVIGRNGWELVTIDRNRWIFKRAQ